MKATDRLITPVRRTAAAVMGMLLCGTICAVCLAQSQQARVLVDDVIPQGNRFVPTQKIISLIKTRPGVEYKDDVVQEDVRRLYDTHLFQNIKTLKEDVGNNKVKVYFIVAEFPSTVQEVVYQGAKHLKPDELDSITGIRKGTPLNPIANQMARQAILRHYNEQGHMWAGVELLEGDKPGDTRVVFNITEGPIARVRSISFTGNTFVYGPRLNTQIDSSHAIFGMLGGKFDPERASHDVSKLEEYYKSYGFHLVRVSRELKWTEDFRMVDLIFHIQEGPRFRVAAVQVDGNKIFNQDELLAPLTVHPGEFYEKRKTEADVKTIQDKYGYNGYPVTVREEDFARSLEQPGEVAVHYVVQERPPWKVGNIIIVGNERTRQNVILRQIPLFPGQILTSPDLRLAEKNLAKLNIFEMNPSTGVRPTVTVIDPDSDTEFKDLLVQVQETTTGSLVFGVGVNSDAGLVGTIALNERNFDITRWPTSFEDLLSHGFRGAGQEFRIEAVPGTQLQRYTVSWRDPFFLDSPFSLGVGAYYYDRIFNEDRESRLGGRMSVGHQFNRYWGASVSLRLEQVGIHDVAVYEPIDYTSVVGEHFLTGLGATVAYDTRDSYLRPTEGHKVELGFEQVLGDFTFPKINLVGDQYWTVCQRADGSGRHVLAAHSQIGWTGSNTPVYERFFAGGIYSMRGFQFRGVGPAPNGFFVGGDFLFLNSLEYQIPILANDQLYGVVFVDSGTVESSVELKNYRVSAGAGLRIVVPMLGPVPIALDFGFPIVKAPQDREEVFSFSVGFLH